MADVKYNENQPEGGSSKKVTLEELKKNAAQDKEQIDALKNAILKKIKSQGVADKAALILSRWLEKDKNSKDKSKNKKSA